MGTNPRGSRSSDGVTDQTKEKEQRRLGGGMEQGTKTGKWTGSGLVCNKTRG